jgi:rhamnose utilization protein RhaD (predicted bifunctional aldolase and dehydrogenase)
MIENVTKHEERITRAGRKQFFSVQLPGTLASQEDVAPVIRGAVVEELVPCEHQYNQFVLDFRSNPDILAYVNSASLPR